MVVLCRETAHTTHDGRGSNSDSAAAWWTGNRATCFAVYARQGGMAAALRQLESRLRWSPRLSAISTARGDTEPCRFACSPMQHARCANVSPHYARTFRLTLAAGRRFAIHYRKHLAKTPEIVIPEVELYQDLTVRVEHCAGAIDVRRVAPRDGTFNVNLSVSLAISRSRRLRFHGQHRSLLG